MTLLTRLSGQGSEETNSELEGALGDQCPFLFSMDKCFRPFAVVRSACLTVCSAAGADDQVLLSNGECRPRADGDMGQLGAGRLFETSRSQRRRLQKSVHLTSPYDVEAKVS
jgi:hypothetical protein